MLEAKTELRGMLIEPVAEPIRGAARPPGSKSITNRALLLAALASGESRITGALKSDDTVLMAAALREMGVEVEEPDETSFTVRASGTLRAPEGPLMLGNAGTAMRFLTAAVALVEGEVVVDGDVHMRKRPIGPLVAALRSVGVDATDTAGCPPVTVKGQGQFRTPGFNDPRVEIDGGLSSQYVSALLMVAAKAGAPVTVALTGPKIGARGYVDLTLAAMRTFGAEVTAVGEGAWRVAPTGYKATDLAVEPDASAATYLWGAAALTGGRIEMGLPDDAFTQPDAKAQAVIAQFPDLPPVIEGGQMQDAIPTIAVLAAFNRGPVRLTGIENLRVKECDRIRALSTELNRIRPGLAVEEGDDLVVQGDPSLAGQHLPTRIETYADHRIAMSFALAGLKIGGIEILDPGCTAKTWPGYWETLAGLGVGLEGTG